MADWSSWFKAVLALVIWREARGEGEDGMRAVAHVIRNRVEATNKPDTWEDVIEGKNQFSSLTVPGDSQLVLWPKQPDPRFEQAMDIAARVYEDHDFDLTNGAHYYANLETATSGWFQHNIVENPQEHPQVAKIGHHTFFR